MEIKECIIEGKRYDPGSEVCDEKLCYLCRDGLWEKESTLELYARTHIG